MISVSACINTIPVRATGGLASARGAGIGISSRGAGATGEAVWAKRSEAGALLESRCRGGLLLRPATAPWSGCSVRAAILILHPCDASYRRCNRDGLEDPAHAGPGPQRLVPWGGCDLNVDHHELRAALERFFAAKRALRHAYRRAEASHWPAELRPRLERGTSEQAGDDPAPIQEAEGLKEENGKLRKSLALLHAHSLRLQDQLDTLLLHGAESARASEAVALGARENPGAEQYPGSAASQLDEHTYSFSTQQDILLMK